MEPMTITLHTRSQIGKVNPLTGPDARAANSFEQPDVIASRPFADIKIAGGEVSLKLPPLSVAAMTFGL